MNRMPRRQTRVCSPRPVRGRRNDSLVVTACAGSDSTTRLGDVSRSPVAAAIEQRRLIGWWTVCCVVAVVCLLTAQAFGQAAPPQFRTVPLNEALTGRAPLTVMERAKTEGLSKADFSESWAGYSEFKKYYQQYQFGKLMDARHISEYGKITQSLLDDLDRAQKARSPAARTLAGWIIAGARSIASGNFHPVARVNATLLLAQLDDQPADLRANRPPTPAAAALPILVQLYRGETSPDGVRAAALQGILRHVHMGGVADPTYRSGIARMALALAESDPPAGRSPEAHAFLQRYAIDLLTILADPNSTPETTQTLVSLSTATGKPNLIAAHAAAKIGRLQPGNAKVNQAPEVLAKWAERAANVVDGELARIARLDPPTAVRDQPAMPTEATRGGGAYDAYPGGGDMSGMMDTGDMSGMMMPDEYDGGMMDYGGMMPGMMMGSRAQPQPLEVITSRRSINHVLQQLQYGATGQRAAGLPRQPGGLLAVVDPAEKPAVEAWVNKIAEVVKAINDETLDDRKKFVEQLEKQATELKRLAGIKVDNRAAGMTARRRMDPSDPSGLLGGGPNAGDEAFDPDDFSDPMDAGPDTDPLEAPGLEPAEPTGIDPLGEPALDPLGGTAVEPANDPLDDPASDPLLAPADDPLQAEPIE